MKKIYENKDFIILWKNKTSSYILNNKHKDFDNGHTHVNNYNTVRWIMRMYTKKKIPKDLHSKYLLKSFIRISNDKDFSYEVEKILLNLEQKEGSH